MYNTCIRSFACLWNHKHNGLSTFEMKVLPALVNHNYAIAGINKIHLTNATDCWVITIKSKTNINTYIPFISLRVSTRVRDVRGAYHYYFYRSNESKLLYRDTSLQLSLFTFTPRNNSGCNLYFYRFFSAVSQTRLSF